MPRVSSLTPYAATSHIELYETDDGQTQINVRLEERDTMGVTGSDGRKV